MADEWVLEDGEGRRHVVTVEGSFVHRVRWEVDGEEVATARTSDEKIQLEAADLGLAVGVWLSFSGAPRRVTLFEGGKGVALLGLGGVDLVPPAGSAAERRERRMREHPRTHEALALVEGVGKVVVPIALTALAVWLARIIPWPDLPDIAWPDLPSIPWPDLPDVPWPDLPSIPWPDWTLPAWLRWILDHAKYVVPVVVAVAVARGEVRRRRQQDERRRAAQRADDATDDGSGDDTGPS